MPELSRWYISHPEQYLLCKHQWPKANSFPALETVKTPSIYCPIQSLQGRYLSFQWIRIYAVGAGIITMLFLHINIYPT